jgi:citrate lyase beta subunit
MPKKLTDKDRILAFAFRATTEDLVDAIAVLKAAHAAKVSGAGLPKPVAATKKRTRKRTPRPAEQQVTAATAGGGTDGSSV